VELERTVQLLGIVTQNVDGLHLAAGSSPDRIVELHGNARSLHCLGCGASLPSEPTLRRASWGTFRCPRCRGPLKAATVSVGEPLPAGAYERAVAWCHTTDLLLVLGTSLAIEPAGLLPGIVHARGVPVVVINDAPTALDPWAAVVIRSPIARTLERARAALRQPVVDRLIRPMTRVDFTWLCRVVDTWWGDSVRYLLHPLFLEHFADTCVVVEEAGILAGFLVGFVSQTRPGEAYVHLVATAPAYRGRNLGRALYAHFFELVRQRGCRKVTALTVPYNAGSLAFHARMGFSFREAGATWCDGLPVHMDYAGPGVHCVIMERMLT
jgi:GNAT superfamily N-acetyltransferase